MPGRVYQRGKIYWISLYYQGKEYRQSAKTENKRAAERVLAHWMAQCATGQFKGFGREESITIGEMIDDLINDCEQRRLRDIKTVRERVLPLRRAFSNVPGDELTERQIDLYLKRQLDSGRAPATIRSELVYLKQAFKIAHRKKLVENIPYIPSIKVENARQGFFEDDEFWRLHDTLPPYLKDLALFAFYSGWRRMEVLTLEWRDVSHDTIRLRPERSKNADGRVLALVGGIADIIERRRAERGVLPWVFHHQGRQIKNFDRAWHNACRDAEMPDKLFHDLRRTAVRNMIRAGVPERVAMSISGHKTRSTFDRYNIVSEADIKQGLDKVFTHNTRP